MDRIKGDTVPDPLLTPSCESCLFITSQGRTPARPFLRRRTNYQKCRAGEKDARTPLLTHLQPFPPELSFHRLLSLWPCGVEPGASLWGDAFVAAFAFALFVVFVFVFVFVFLFVSPELEHATAKTASEPNASAISFFI